MKMNRLMIAAASATAIGFSALAANWFNGGVEAGWPDSAEGGSWSNTTEQTSYEAGTLTIDADAESPVMFCADEAKAIGDDNKNVEISTTVAFTPFMALPNVPTGAKVGVAVIRGDADALSFYVLAKDGDVNVWTNTQIAATKTASTVKILVSDDGTATYTFGEAAFKTAIMADGAISTVGYAGNGSVASLSATFKANIVTFDFACPADVTVDSVTNLAGVLTAPYAAEAGTDVWVTYKTVVGKIFADGSRYYTKKVTATAGTYPAGTCDREVKDAKPKRGTIFYLSSVPQYAPAVYWADGYSGKMGIQTGCILAGHNEPRMILGGVPLYVTGVNCYNLFVQCHEADNMNTTQMEQAVKVLASNKVPVVRFSCSPYYASQMSCYTEQKEKYLANLDRLGDLCDQYKILLIPSVFWNSACLPEYFSEHISQWGNADSKTYKFMLEYTKDVVNTLKRHKCLAAWEFGNEFNLQADIGIAGYPQVSAAQMASAMQGFAETVRDNDPEGRMICSGNSVMRNSQWHLYHVQDWTTDSFDQYAEISGVLTPSPMTGMSEHLYEESRIFSDLGTLSRSEQVACAKACAAKNGKVYYVGEFTGPGSRETLSAHYQVYLDQKVQLSMIWNYALNGDVEHSFSADTESGRMVFGLIREYNEKFASITQHTSLGR